jgi:hypothetical protein
MWGEAVRTAAFLLNRCPLSTVDKTPSELWTGKKPNLERLQIFGSIAYAKHLKHLKNPRSKKYIMVGYAPNGFRLWDKYKRTVITARDVAFEKNILTKQKTVELKLSTEEETNTPKNIGENEKDAEEHGKRSDMDAPMVEKDEDQTIPEPEIQSPSKPENNVCKQDNIVESPEDEVSSNNSNFNLELTSSSGDSTILSCLQTLFSGFDGF